MKAAKINILQLHSHLDVIGATRILALLSKSINREKYNTIVAAYLKKVEDSFLMQELEQANIKVINLGFGKNRLRRLEGLIVMRRVKNLIQREKIDIIHSHSLDGDIYAFSPNLLLRRKMVITLHSLRKIRWMREYNLRYKLLFFSFIMNRFVCVSENLRKEAIKQCKISPSKISTINNAPSPDFFLPFNPQNRIKIREEFNIIENELLIGAIGHPTRRGILYLFEALSFIKHSSFKLLLVGENGENCERMWKSFLNEKSLSSSVIFAGFRRDIPAVLDAIDLFVHSSIEDADPLSVSEAMAKGKPVIATSVGDIPKKIINGKTGILISPANGQILASAINFCISNFDKAKEMGRNARKFIKDNFSAEKMAGKYEKIYRELIEQK